MLIIPERTCANKDFSAEKEQRYLLYIIHSLRQGKVCKIMEKGCGVQSVLTPACGSSPAELPGRLEWGPTLERSQVIHRHWLP